MAAVRLVCFSPLITSPFVYPSLCARHRKLWTTLSSRAAAYFSSSTSNDCQKVVDNLEKTANSSRVANTPLQSQGAQEWSKEYCAKMSSAASEPHEPLQEHTEVHPVQITSEHQGNKVPSRSNNPKNQNVLHQRLLPQTGNSDIVFTIGKRRLSLENAQALLDTHNHIDSSASTEVQSDVGGGKSPSDLISLSVQTKRSRANNPSVTTSDLVNHIRKRHDLSQKDMELYSASLPSLLGVNVDTLSNTAAKLEEAGFSVKEVHQLLSVFPHIFSVNYENMFAVYKVFKDHIKNTRFIQGLIYRYPFLLTLDPSQVCVCVFNQCIDAGQVATDLGGFCSVRFDVGGIPTST